MYNKKSIMIDASTSSHADSGFNPASIEGKKEKRKKQSFVNRETEMSYIPTERTERDLQCWVKWWGVGEIEIAGLKAVAEYRRNCEFS